MAARPNNSNKFTSINLNDVFDKKTTSSTKPKTHHQSSTSQSSASYKSHNGRMLLLSRSPSPRPIKSPLLSSPVPDRGQPDEDLISLRPLGRTGPVNPPPLPPPPSLSPLPSPTKTDKFVPPHLRPGFMGKEERQEEAGGRPKSGGHDRGRAHDQGLPGGRPSSSG